MFACHLLPAGLEVHHAVHLFAVTQVPDGVLFEWVVVCVLVLFYLPGVTVAWATVLVRLATFMSTFAVENEQTIV